MAGKDPYGMAIRLPEDMVVMLKKLRDEQQLPSMATAIKFWVEQATNEKIETRIIKLEQKVSDTYKALLELLPQYRGAICQHCAALNHILGSEHPIAQHLRKTMKCKECSFSECPGLVE